MEGATTGIAGFFQEIGNGLSALLPGVAGSAVGAIDTLMYTPDGTLTTFAQLGIIGIVCGAAFAIFKLVTHKARKGVGG